METPGPRDRREAGPHGRPKDKVFLIGFSATGKSHSGRLAAQELGARFVDMDRLIVRRTGRQISEIFEQEGEEAFRRIERDLLRELVETRGQRVISTGGGVPVDPENREVMARTGVTIRLVASPETIHSRLSHGRPEGARGATQEPRRRAAVRPMLAGAGNNEITLERVRELLAEREPAYAAAADFAINTEGREPPDVATEIVFVIRNASRVDEETA